MPRPVPLLASLALSAALSALTALSGCHRGTGADGDFEPDLPLGGDTTSAAGCIGCDAVPQTTRFARLSHLQWENSVQDLLHLPGPTGLSDTFIGDTLSEGFANDADNLQVSPELWLDYQHAAETLAVQVVTDPGLYAVVVPQDPRTGDGGPVFDEVVEAESGAANATTGASAGSAWNLWSQGEVRTQVDLPTSGRYTLKARVWADQAGPDLAEATLGLDGVDALTTDVSAVSSGSAEEIRVDVDASAGIHTLHVGFTNDYYQAPDDRNLYVDWLGVEGSGGGLGGSTATDADRDAWIAAFGRRAYRRPLSADEVAAHADLFDQGPDLVGTGDDFADGVQLVLTAMLQSPWFLYRIESSSAPGADGRIPLSSDELASKLSYALWNTMPDDALFAAADAGTLTDPTTLSAEAERLLDHPRAVGAIEDLHRQLLFLDSYDNIYKDPVRYPEFTATTPQSMKDEALAFVDDVVVGGESVHDLFTAPRTFVNADLAPIYGLSGDYGDELVAVDLDPTERGGLLTLSGFLALEADPYISSPIRRGVFVNLEVWCVDLPPPPNNVTPLPPPDGVKTTRELVNGHTGPGTCGEGCHSTLINPPGFAFESYDAMGRYRETENGQPIDASGSYQLSNGQQTWTDTSGFTSLVGDAIETHRCYTQHLLEYLHGRAAAPEDDALIAFVAARSKDEDRPIRDLMLNLVLSDSFRMRSAEVQ